MSIINIYHIIAIACLAWVVTHFEPLIYLRSKIPIDRNKKISLLLIVDKILSCSKCFSFWFALVYFSGNIFLAAVTCVLAVWIDNNTSTIKL